jgi:hypothetical protein
MKAIELGVAQGVRSLSDPRSIFINNWINLKIDKNLVVLLTRVRYTSAMGSKSAP